MGLLKIWMTIYSDLWLGRHSRPLEIDPLFRTHAVAVSLGYSCNVVFKLAAFMSLVHEASHDVGLSG